MTARDADKLEGKRLKKMKPVNGLVDAPLFYIDGTFGLMSGGDLVKFGLCQDLMDADGQVIRKVVLTLCMTRETMVNIGQWMQDGADKIEKAEVGHDEADHG